MTEMEVVVLCVSEEHDDGKGVDERSSGGVLPKVTGLVPPNEPLGLDFRCVPSGKLLVEAHDPLHASGILCGTETLGIIISLFSVNC